MKTALPLILIAVAIGSYYVYIAPQYTVVTELRAEETKYVEAEEKALELTRVYDRLATEYNSLSQADIAKLDAFLPDTIDPTRFATDIDGIAAKYGIRIQSVNITNNDVKTSATEPSGKPFITNVVTLKFKAPYQNFVQFVKDLERSLTILDVTRVNFTSAESNAYDFDVLLQVYSLNSK